MNTSTNQTGMPTNPPPEDEIDLIDLALAFWRRRRVFAVVVLLFVVAGTVFALQKPAIYEYRAIVEIGAIDSDFLQSPEIISRSGAKLLQSPEAVLAKLKGAYIPDVVARRKQAKEGAVKFNLEAKIEGRKTPVLSILGKGPQDHENLYLESIKTVVDRLVEDHARLLNGRKLEYQLAVRRAETGLADIDRYIALRKTQMAQLQKRLQSTKRQIAEMQNLLYDSDAFRHRRAATQGVTDEPEAMTLLLLDSQRRDDLRRLDTLEERVLDIQNQTQRIQGEIEKLQQSKRLKQEEIELAKLRFKNMRETRLVYGPATSPDPVGMGKAQLISLSTVLGLFVGMLAVFVAEFSVKIRERTSRPE